MADISAGEPDDDFDFRLLSNGPVSLYRDHDILKDACSSLEALGYRIVRFDAASWSDLSVMYDHFADAFDFPDYFGRNVAALNDCLSDVAAGGYGDPEDVQQLALVLTGFDSFARREPQVAQLLADIVAEQSRFALLLGRRLLCLLQVDDARFMLRPVGAQAVSWNPAEWLDSKRGL